MTPQSTSQTRKSEAQSRTIEEAARIEAAREAAKRDLASTPRKVSRPEDDKYFDPPCTD
jgi:hypothetical protein